MAHVAADATGDVRAGIVEVVALGFLRDGGADGVVKEGIPKEEADDIRGKLEAAGATVEVK